MMANGMTICNFCGKLVHAAPGICTLCGEEFQPRIQAVTVTVEDEGEVWEEAA